MPRDGSGIDVARLRADTPGCAGVLHLNNAGAALPGVAVHDLGRGRCGIVTFTVPGMAAREASARLRAQGINTSVSTAPFARWDMAPRGLAELVRASPHACNTEDELDRFIDAVAGLGGGTRDG